MSVSDTHNQADRGGTHVSANEMLGKKLKKLTFETPTQHHQKLKRIAGDRGIYVRDLLNEAIEQYIFKKYLQESDNKY